MKTMTMTDGEKILQALLKHDRGAFASFYQEWRPKLYSLALSHVWNKSAAEDISIDCLGNFLLRLRENADIKNPGAYLRKAVRNKCLTFLSERKKSGYPDFDAMECLAQNSDPQSQSIRDEEFLHCQKLLENLPEDLKEVVRLRVYGNLTFTEIAELHDSPLPTISKRYYKALSIIRENWELKK